MVTSDAAMDPALSRGACNVADDQDKQDTYTQFQAILQAITGLDHKLTNRMSSCEKQVSQASAKVSQIGQGCMGLEVAQAQMRENSVGFQQSMRDGYTSLAQRLDQFERQGPPSSLATPSTAGTSAVLFVGTTVVTRNSLYQVGKIAVKGFPYDTCEADVEAVLAVIETRIPLLALLIADMWVPGIGS